MSNNLRRRQGVYWFRRRVPEALIARIGAQEIHRRLRTNVYAEAVSRAKAAWIATEKAFQTMSSDQSIDHMIARVLIDRLLAEPVIGSATAQAIVASLIDGDGAHYTRLASEQSLEIVAGLPPDQRTHIEGHLQAIGDRTEIGVARYGQSVEALGREIERLRKEKAIGALAAADKARVEAEIALQVSMRLAEIGSGSGVDRPSDKPPAAEEAPPKIDERPRSTKGKQRPLWSAVEAGFLREKTRSVEGHEGYDQQTVRQTEITLYLWREFIGDRPIDQYSGEDAGEFRELMLRMPASHGKGGTRSETRQKTPPAAAIKQADERQAAIDARNACLPPDSPREPDVNRLKMKTLKRHFSTLSQIWIYAGRHGYVPRDQNPFRAWEYQGVRRGQRKRGPWSTEDLSEILRSPWFAKDTRKLDEYWITLIAMFGGLRVEEICRLRPGRDIQTIEGILAIVVQEQPAPAPWSPKTEAGERVVPVHSEIQNRGFLEFVNARRNAGCTRLFPSYKLRPSSNKLSAKFVTDFSRLKTKLGVGPQTTFHSFRHNISTCLRNTPISEARESWIDAVLGHAGGEDDVGRSRRQSEDVKTYLAEIGIKNLKATVEAIAYPGVEFCGLLNRQPKE